jgi:hypothetical protein
LVVPDLHRGFLATNGESAVTKESKMEKLFCAFFAIALTGFVIADSAGRLPRTPLPKTTPSGGSAVIYFDAPIHVEVKTFRR